MSNRRFGTVQGHSISRDFDMDSGSSAAHRFFLAAVLDWLLSSSTRYSGALVKDVPSSI